MRLLAIILVVLAAAVSATAQSGPLIYPGGVTLPGLPPAPPPPPGLELGTNLDGLVADHRHEGGTVGLPERIGLILYHHGAHTEAGLPEPVLWPETWVYVLVSPWPCPAAGTPWGLLTAHSSTFAAVAIRLLPHDWSPISTTTWTANAWFGQHGTALPSGIWAVQGFVVHGHPGWPAVSWLTNEAKVTVP